MVPFREPIKSKRSSRRTDHLDRLQPRDSCFSEWLIGRIQLIAHVKYYIPRIGRSQPFLFLLLVLVKHQCPQALRSRRVAQAERGGEGGNHQCIGHTVKSLLSFVSIPYATKWILRDKYNLVVNQVRGDIFKNNYFEVMEQRQHREFGNLKRSI